MADQSPVNENPKDPRKNKLLQQFENRVQASSDKWKDRFDEIDRARKLLKGMVPDSVPEAGAGLIDTHGDPLTSGDEPPKSTKVRANLLLATNEAMLPLIYAKNPEVRIRPSEKVSSEVEGMEYVNAKAWAQTLEIVTKQQITTGGLKKQAKKAVRSAQSAKVGWLKVTFQRDYQKDPEILNRMNDVQDNLVRIEGLIRQMSEQNYPVDDEEAKAQQLRELITALEETPEILQAEGIVIDHVPTKQMRMDASIACIEDYPRARWIGHYNDISVEDYQNRFNVDEEGMRGVKIFTEKSDGLVEESTFSLEKKYDGLKPCVRLWEVWNRDDNKIYLWAEGAMDFAREPWVPQGLGERWYPFFLVAFHWLDGEEWPESDVDLLEQLQQEYNDTREQKNQHRKSNVPHYIMAGDETSPEDVTSFTVAGAREIVVVNSQGRPIKEILQPSPQIPMNPYMYDTADIRFDMQWMVGLQDAARGGVVKAKTLGEAEIAENHLASRSGNLQDELEEMLTELATYVAQILLQKMKPETVRKIAGPNAYWPSIPRADVFDMFDIEIEAGSTGKPDQRAEREQWAELLPLLIQLVGQILEMRQMRQMQDGSIVQGMPDNLNPMVNILELTLKRFDERIDLESILPPQEQQMQPQIPGMEAMPGAGMASGPGLPGAGAGQGFPGNPNAFPPQQPMG